VSDFVITFRSAVASSVVADRLAGRPHLSTRRIVTKTFTWGAVIVQAPPDAGYLPVTASTGELYFCIGRPIVSGTRIPARPDGLSSVIAAKWHDEGAANLWRELSGLFIVGRCDNTGVTLLTDPMGVRPVYVATDEGGAITALGSHVDSLALASGKRTSIDLVSVAELLVFSNITYPFTSREGISELAPASLCSFTATESGIRAAHQVLWEPRESDGTSEEALTEELVDAMRVAGREITDGVDSVGLTLSGGRDSRAVLCALPPEKRAGAITFVTRQNRESSVARAVAAAAGVPHYFAERPTDFYERLMERSVALQGCEQRGQAHGICIPDCGLHELFHVIVSGQFADTFLKDHFMPEWMRAEAAPSGRRRPFFWWLSRRNDRAPQGDLGTMAWLENGALLKHLRRDIGERVRARHEQRFAEVSRVRLRSAAEWTAIWPASRRYAAASHVQGNSRTFPSDTLYVHRRIIDVAVRIPPHLRLGGALANRAFQRLYGSTLSSLEDANTGLPITAGEKAERIAENRRKKSGRASEFKRLPPSAAPWNDVHSSWVDMEVLQQHSAHWAALRRRLSSSAALDVLGAVLVRDPVELVREYQPALPFGFNFMAIQLVHYLDLALAGNRSVAPLR
jgi:asparagine synthetase B (glutamine-hydrolysing)